jgi:prefoldin subunit 5
MKKFLMSVLWVALFVGLGAMYYYQTTFDARINSMNERAGKIEEKYQKFTDQLDDLEVKFVGRAKHVRQNQKDIENIYNQIDIVKKDHNQDMFSINTRVDSLGALVDNNMANLETQVEALRKVSTSLRAMVNQNQITTNNQLQRMTRSIEALEKKVEEIEILVTPDEEDSKRRR